MPLGTKTNIDIKDYINKQKSIIDNYLTELFNNNKDFAYPKELWEAVRYSLLNGGKRIRGIFCLASCESIINSYTEDCLKLACSIEIVHAMSLIHDDLPAMDDDDLRRGKPSCHKAFGEANAILAGDAMLSMAFMIVSDYMKNTSSEKKVELINLLSRTFTLGLVPGQILDLINTEEKSDLKLTEEIYRLKTAELIKASILGGAIITLEPTHENTKIINRLGHFGLKVGTAFQIIDDILDITCDTKTLGKTSGKDKTQKKGTFAMILGIQKSKEIAEKLIKEANQELELLPINSHLLSGLSQYVINRIN